MFTLCFVPFFRCFCLSFELHFLIHFAPLMHYLLPLFIASFLSLLSFDSFVYSWQKKGKVYWKVYLCVLSFLYDSCAHSQSKKFYLVHIRRVKKPKVRCIYQGREDIFFWENLVLLCLSLCLFSHCFMVLWVMFSIYALLLPSHRAYVLDIHTSLC